MGISKLIAGTAGPFAIAAQRAFAFNISMIKVAGRSWLATGPLSKKCAKSIAHIANTFTLNGKLNLD